MLVPGSLTDVGWMIFPGPVLAAFLTWCVLKQIGREREVACNDIRLICACIPIDLYTGVVM